VAWANKSLHFPTGKGLSGKQPLGKIVMFGRQHCPFLFGACMSFQVSSKDKVINLQNNYL